MDIKIYGKNFELTSALKDYVNNKIGHLEHYHDRIIDIKVELASDPKHHSGKVFYAEVNMNIPGRLIRAIEWAEDGYAAIDLVEQKMIEQLKKYKGKQEGKWKRFRDKISLRRLFGGE